MLASSELSDVLLPRRHEDVFVFVLLFIDTAAVDLSSEVTEERAKEGGVWYYIPAMEWIGVPSGLGADAGSASSSEVRAGWSMGVEVVLNGNNEDAHDGVVVVVVECGVREVIKCGRENARVRYLCE